jgi:hypothetical protein
LHPEETLSDFSSEGDSLEGQDRVMVTPQKTSSKCDEVNGMVVPSEESLEKAAGIDNLNLKTQASKTTAKSTPVMEDQVEDSDESMIESCSSSSHT